MAPQSQRKQQNAADKTDRGQTSIDLLLAVGLFFTAVAIVSMQSPVLFGLNSVSASDNYVPAEATAETLETELSSTSSTGLDEAKVEQFFDKQDSNVTDSFSLPDDINASIRLTHIDSGDPPVPLDGTLSTSTTSDGDVYVERGPPVDGIESTANEYTTLNNERVKITVTVWLDP